MERAIYLVHHPDCFYLLHRRAETSALLLDLGSGYFGFGRGGSVPERHGAWRGGSSGYHRTDASWLLMVGPDATQLCSLCTTRGPREDQWAGTSVENKTTTQHRRTTKRAYHCCCPVIMGRSSESNCRTAKLIRGPISGRPMTYTAPAAD
jgi:hypothetical protein